MALAPLNTAAAVAAVRILYRFMEYQVFIVGDGKVNRLREIYWAVMV
jgi:hypothetical protein